MKFRIEIEGKSAPRPRVGKYGVYNPKSYTEYKDILSTMAKMAMAGSQPLEGDLTLSVVFGRKTRRRADIDNLLKGVMDALNKIVYLDDSQITSLQAKKITAATPYIEVEVQPSC